MACICRKKAKNFLFAQYKTLIRNKSGSIEDRAVKFAWFSDMAD